MHALIDDFTQLMPYLDGSLFDENMVIKYASDADVGFRDDILVDLCRGKRVLHVGCCDHITLIGDKIAQNLWLHGLITSCSESTVGIDIDSEAIVAASRISGLDNMFAGDVTSSQIMGEVAGRKFDVALLGEVLEHIPNPANFLTRLRENYGDCFSHIVVTVPNAFRGGNIRGVLNNVETVNSDHRFFFTPYTIAKVALDAGFRPQEIRMATFTRAGRAKSALLKRKPLLAEDIVFMGSHRSK